MTPGQGEAPAVPNSAHRKAVIQIIANAARQRAWLTCAFMVLAFPLVVAARRQALAEAATPKADEISPFLYTLR